MGICEGKKEYEQIQQQFIQPEEQQLKLNNLQPVQKQNQQQKQLTQEEIEEIHGPPSNLSVKILNPPNLLNELTESIYQRCGDFLERSQPDQNCTYNFGAIQLHNETSIYIGEWRNKKRNGIGKLYYQDGSFYQGEFLNDVAHGKGRLIHPDGDYYEGDWQNEQAHGYGTFVHIDGAKYEGEWAHDKQHGRGCEIWQDGAIYEGDYLNGCLKYADGTEYKGQFYQDKRQGEGEYKDSNGKVYVGQWDEDQQHGKLKFFVSIFVRGKLHESGKVYETEWEQGQCIREQEVVN